MSTPWKIDRGLYPYPYHCIAGLVYPEHYSSAIHGIFGSYFYHPFFSSWSMLLQSTQSTRFMTFRILHPFNDMRIPGFGCFTLSQWIPAACVYDKQDMNDKRD
jgi:hypothetical protein